MRRSEHKCHLCGDSIEHDDALYDKPRDIWICYLCIPDYQILYPTKDSEAPKEQPKKKPTKPPINEGFPIGDIFS